MHLSAGDLLREERNRCVRCFSGWWALGCFDWGDGGGRDLVDGLCKVEGTVASSASSATSNVQLPIINKNRGSELGEMITTYIKEGKIVPGASAMYTMLRPRPCLEHSQ